MSPHVSADIVGITIEAEKLTLPQASNNLVVELAGGLMVPLTKDLLMVHRLKQWNLSVILVSKYYLGSINHTLLSIEVLKAHNIPIEGIIFNGETNPTSKEAILAYSELPLIGEILWVEEEMNKEKVKELAQLLISKKSCVPLNTGLKNKQPAKSLTSHFLQFLASSGLNLKVSTVLRTRQ